MITKPTLPPTTSTPDIPVNKPQHKGLFAKWEMVDGKLICKWLRSPD